MLFITAVVVINKKDAETFTAKVPASLFPDLFGKEQDKARSLQLCTSRPSSLSHPGYELRTYYVPGPSSSPEI